MNYIDALQGSDLWLSIRAKHFTASEAPAMLGASKYMTRSELLHQKHTGVSPDVDAHKQALFDRGHAAEEAARPFVEKYIGEELSPVTGALDVDGLPLLASFDGINFGGDTVWEHKLWSESLAKSISADVIEPNYYWQLEQQLLVAGADRVFFSASDGTEEKTVGVWYVSRPERRAALIAGWHQFKRDLDAYIPPEVVHAAVAAPIMALPALAVQVNGAITITDNLAVFGEKLQSFIGGLNTKPEDDQGFADIEAAVKVLQKAQDALEASEANALAQVASVDEMRRTVKLYIDMARDTRLMLDKVVKQRKELIKTALIDKANYAYREHIESLEAEIVPIRLSVVKPDFASAAKNKRTIASLRDSLDTALAQSKIETDAVAKDIRAKLAWFREFSAYEFLFRDMQQVIQKPLDDFQLTVTARIAAHKTAEEEKLDAERQRIQAEEEKKARAKIEQEQRAVVTEKVVAVVVAQERLVKALAPEPVDPIPAAGKMVAANRRPSDREIIRSLCIEFRVSESVVVGWLKGMDLSCVSVEAA